MINGSQDAVLSLAERHRVLGLLMAGLGLSKQTDDLDGWRRKAFSRTHYTACLSSETASISRALKPVIPGLKLIKGTALSVQAWPQTGLRDYDDIDFRCPKEAFDPLVSQLDKMGYRLVYSLRHAQHLWHYGWGICFANSRGIRVECNHRFFPPQYPWPQSLSDDKQQWQSMCIDTADICTPTPVLHLIYCCAHAAWHGWGRLSWLADIGALLHRYPEACDTAVEIVKLNRFTDRALKTGCALARHYFGAPCSEALLSSINDALLAQIESQWVSTKGPSFSVQRRYHLSLMSPGEQLGYYTKRLITPGDPDFTWLNLPRSVRHLYWVLRPVRMVLKKASGTFDSF